MNIHKHLNETKIPQIEISKESGLTPQTLCEIKKSPDRESKEETQDMYFNGVDSFLAKEMDRLNDACQKKSKKVLQS